jgi:hypothetical protein
MNARAHNEERSVIRSLVGWRKGLLSSLPRNPCPFEWRESRAGYLHPHLRAFLRFRLPEGKSRGSPLTTRRYKRLTKNSVKRNCVPTTPNPKPPHSAARYARSCARGGAEESNSSPTMTPNSADSAVRTRLKTKVVIAKPKDVPS